MAFSAFLRLLSAQPFLLDKKFCLFVCLLKKQQIRLINFYGESKILFFSFVLSFLLLPTEGPGRIKQCSSNSAIPSLRSQFKNLLLQECPLVCFLITFSLSPVQMLHCNLVSMYECDAAKTTSFEKQNLELME